MVPAELSYGELTALLSRPVANAHKHSGYTTFVAKALYASPSINRHRGTCYTMCTCIESHDRYKPVDSWYRSLKLVSIDVIEDREFLQHTAWPHDQVVGSVGPGSSSANEADDLSTSRTNLLVFENPSKPVRKRQTSALIAYSSLGRKHAVQKQNNRHRRRD